MVKGSQKVSLQAIFAYKKYRSDFFKKGIAIALFSGLTYGMYTALITMGMKKEFGLTGMAIIKLIYQHLL